MTTSEFILQHRLSNPRDLALQARRYPDVDMPYALNQIQGWQTARQKLPSWAACDGVVYPPHLNMEQCSSEPTARYKQQVVRRWLARLGAGQGGAATSMADLTGGFGVDFSFTSRCFASATYVERNAALCDVVRGNLPCLGIANAQVMCAEAEDCLATMPQQTMLFLDPARRDEHGAKTVLIADCTPDVCHLLPLLMSKARFVMLKLSPMLDWHKAIVDLQGTVREVHIVSVGGECKELLLVLAALDGAASSADTGSNGVEAGVRVCCVDIMAKADAEGEYKRSEFCYTIGDASENTPTPSTLNPQPSTLKSQFLLEPNASIMKAGCFAELGKAYGIRAISSNSHLFLSADRVEGFPGREFVVEAVTTLNKRQLKETLGSLQQANISVRNFPMSVAELRKRLKLRDGGDTYIFATTTREGERVLIVGHKV
ncbi:MAG: SAM-dependent methyltransferase [Prevotella sp.]|uniref:THUMP-like domain-containing protein n=1 Tax=Prevotella sp. TaxID=59823 RepID=UPI0025DE4FA8|nr:SAM-dependent methyltransferase [Prevotella sp.]MCI7119076.1 SAM-dependent methyltransferase [Prevotella sp.]